MNRLLKPLGWEIRRRSKSADVRFPWGRMRRLLYFSRLFDLVAERPGHVVECGVRSGIGLLSLAYLVADEGKGRRLFGFDSFQGLPPPTREDRRAKGLRVQQGDMSARIEETERLFRRCRMGGLFDDQISLVPGFFENTLPEFAEPIAFLHLDCDLYDSYRTCLQRLYPLVVDGGLILFDEYDTAWPGAVQAIDESVAEFGGRLRRDARSDKHYLIKGT